jgi:hypothetical protein
MAISTGNGITPSPEARFFLAPEKTLHRQYEALRAFFVDKIPSLEAAKRFGYSPGGFRVLCHRFRRDRGKEDRFFKDIEHGPKSAPRRDRLREKVVAMRKRNLSVYDIRRELALAQEKVSINALAILLREEGFSRLPRRRDEERPAAVRPELAPVADVRGLAPSPRVFRTEFAGLFFFVPLLEKLDLSAIAAGADLPAMALTQNSTCRPRTAESIALRGPNEHRMRAMRGGDPWYNPSCTHGGSMSTRK